MPGRVAVIGGGCAGVLAARELSRDGRRVELIDPAERPGRGVAYGACRPWHLLNSPAAAMSVDGRRPRHFVEWLHREGVPAADGDFVSRAVYGDYLLAALDEARTSARGGLSVRRDTVNGLWPDDTGVDLALGTGSLIRADQAVLALGNPASPGPRVLSGAPGYRPDPWRAGALESIGDAEPVLLVGTGLTAVDVALTLARRPRTAPTVAVSRHGLLPRVHGAPREHPVEPRRFRATGLAALLREVRSAAETDWRSIVDGMRGDVNALWTRLAETERDRFLTHVARYWEVHRHRMAPRVAQELTELAHSGQWRPRADAVTGCSAVAGGVEVTFASGVTQRFGAIVNCTGPERLPWGANDLVRSLLNDGTARTGPHLLGLDVDGRGRVRRRDGRINPRLWTIGPLRRGVLWESTAVPEIREQAEGLALAINTTNMVGNTER